MNYFQYIVCFLTLPDQGRVHDKLVIIWRGEVISVLSLEGQILAPLSG